MRTWLILGATSGIARAFARVVAAHGDALVLAARDEKELETAAADLRLRGAGSVETVAFDALDRASHAGFARDTAAGRPLDVFLAFALMPSQAEIEADPAQALATVDATYTGAVSILEHLAPRLAAQGQGRVAVLGSVAGDRGRRSNYVYGSAKAGLATYTEGLRARLMPAGVGVVLIKLGVVDTGMSWAVPGAAKMAADPMAVARRCLALADANRTGWYVPAPWAVIMTVFKLLPDPILRRLKL